MAERKQNRKSLEIRLPPEVAEQYKRVSKMTGVNINDVIAVVLGFEVLRQRLPPLEAPGVCTNSGDPSTQNSDVSKPSTSAEADGND